MTKINFGISNICTAFKKETIGSKVLDHKAFLAALEMSIKSHDTSKDIVEGQHAVGIPEEFWYTVSAGDGPKSKDPKDYVVRNHREGPKMFLCRECAGEISSLRVIVYTKEAYLNDPDIESHEQEELESKDCEVTHLIVAVLASSAGPSPVTPYRFVHNLAGGNREYMMPEDAYDGRDAVDFHTLQDFTQGLIDKAKEVKEYWDNNAVVAD